MGKPIRAEVDGRILAWARSLLRMTIPVAAKKIGVSPEQLKAWEGGQAVPTVVQLRKAARVYGQSFAVFFLPEPPDEFDPDLPDYRRAPGVSRGDLSPEFLLDIRTSAERRESYLEVLMASGQEFRDFSLEANVTENPESVGKRFRVQLRVTKADQLAWPDERIAFNAWRAAVEDAHVLVFQSGDVALTEMRGYSIAEYPYPVVVVNRKDLYRARIFSLLHELCHLAVRRSGICDLKSSLDLPPEEQRIEVFCNAVGAATLVPGEWFLSEERVVEASAGEVSDSTIRDLARRYSVSGEVVFRRLLTFGRASEEEYRRYRDRLDRYGGPPGKTGKGFVPPPTDVISKAGRRYAGTILSAYRQSVITGSDTAALLDARLKHLDAIGALLEG